MPFYPFLLCKCSSDYLRSSGSYSLDENGIIEVDYGYSYQIAGKRHNPFIIANYALALYQDYRNSGNSSLVEPFKKQIKWLFDHKTAGEYQGTEFWVWEYNFDNLPFGAKAPWVSSMSQGNTLCAFLAAYELTSDAKYLHAAECAYHSFLVPASMGGVATFDNDVAWYEEVADVGANSSKILNGHIIAVQSLWTFWKWTGKWDVKQSLDLGIAAVKKDIPLYDAGFISYYGQYPEKNRKFAQPNGYNKLHVRQLVWLYELTGDPVFIKYALKFAGYDAPDWNITVSGSIDPIEHGPNNLLSYIGKKYWSDNQFPAWVQLDLKKPQVIKGVALIGYTNKTTPHDFQVFISDDGKAWRQILERSDNKDLRIVEHFDPVVARFVKVVLLSVSNDSGDNKLWQILKQLANKEMRIADLFESAIETIISNANDNNRVELIGVAVIRDDAVPMAVSDWESYKSGILPTDVFKTGWMISKDGWIIADLGDDPGEIGIKVLGSRNQCQFSILGSEDLTTFKPIALQAIEKTNDDLMMTLRDVGFRYLKVEFHEGCKGKKLRIEVQ